MFQVRKVKKKGRGGKKEVGRLPRSGKGWDAEVWVEWKWEGKGLSEKLEVKGEEVG